MPTTPPSGMAAPKLLGLALFLEGLPVGVQGGDQHLESLPVGVHRMAADESSHDCDLNATGAAEASLDLDLMETLAGGGKAPPPFSTARRWNGAAAV